MTGCITRKFEDESLIKVEKWLNENIDYIVPQNNPNLLLKLISEYEYGHMDINDFGMIDI